MKEITDTFVLIASDCPVSAAVVPVPRGATLTVAVIQHELLTARPYALTHADLIFETHVRRAGLSRAEAKALAATIRAELWLMTINLQHNIESRYLEGVPGFGT